MPQNNHKMMQSQPPHLVAAAAAQRSMLEEEAKQLLHQQQLQQQQHQHQHHQQQSMQSNTQRISEKILDNQKLLLESLSTLPQNLLQSWIQSGQLKVTVDDGEFLINLNISNY
jgi:7-keto-8-aminopelargonate synthetase-like enzyme